MVPINFIPINIIKSKINYYKVGLLLKTLIFIYMGRPIKTQEEKKIKIGISIDRELYKKIKNENLKPSRVIEKLLREHYGN
jgi:hypothetical protein